MSRRKITYNPKLDFYEILGINASASREEIQRIYRQKAKLLHPDVNPERREWATEQFQRLNEAYDVLSDTDLRKQYDEMRWPYILPKSASRHIGNNSKSWSAEDRWWEQSKKSSRTFDPFYSPPPRRQAGAWLERYGLKSIRPFYAAVVDLFNSPYRFVLNLLGLMIVAVIGFQLLVFAGAIGLQMPEDESNKPPRPTRVAAANNNTGIVPTQIPPSLTPEPTVVSLMATLQSCEPNIFASIGSIERVGRVLQIRADYVIPNGDTITDTRNVALTRVNLLGDNRVERILGTEIVEPEIDFILNSNSDVNTEETMPLVTSALETGIYWIRWTPILANGGTHRTCDQLIQISAP